MKKFSQKLCFLLLALLLTTTTHSKVYDCFCFYNEFEILKIRLEELWDVVDHFVLVESIETQRGDLKPLFFEENARLFEKYSDKIIPVSIRERHPEFGDWERENYQRNCISRALTHCEPSDIIIISDVDEIPRKSLFPKIIDQLILQEEQYGKHHPKARRTKIPFVINGISLQQAIYFYQLNRQTPSGETWGGGCWVGTVFTTFKNLEKVCPQYFRSHNRKFPTIMNAGWHFTWMGGRDKIRQKLKSVVEGNSALSESPDAAIDEWINKHPAVPIDETFPRYIIDNLDYLKSKGFIASY